LLVRNAVLGVVRRALRGAQGLGLQRRTVRSVISKIYPLQIAAHHDEMKCPFFKLAETLPSLIGAILLACMLVAVLGSASFLVFLIAFVVAYKRQHGKTWGKGS